METLLFLFFYYLLFLFIIILSLSPFLSLPLHFNVAETVLFVLRMNRIQRASTARCSPPRQLFQSKHFAFSFGTRTLFKNLAKVIGSMVGPLIPRWIVHNVSKTCFPKKRLEAKRRFQFSASIIGLNPWFFTKKKIIAKVTDKIKTRRKQVQSHCTDYWERNGLTFLFIGRKRGRDFRVEPPRIINLGS